MDVKHQRPRGKGPEERVAGITDRLAREGALGCSIRVPDAVGPIGLDADLRTRRVTTTVEIAGPKEGRPKTRVNWLLRQLADAPGDLRVEVRFSQVRATCSELLSDCLDAPEKLLLADDPKREPRSFLLAHSRPMGKKRGRADGSFVAETRKQTTDFYRDLVQGLMPPRTKAPKLRDDEQKVPEADPPVPEPQENSESEARREREASLQRLADIMPFSP